MIGCLWVKSTACHGRRLSRLASCAFAILLYLSIASCSSGGAPAGSGGGLADSSPDNAAAASPDGATTVGLGETVKTDCCEFSFASYEWTKDLLPPDTSGGYSHIESDEGETFYAVHTDFTYTGKQEGQVANGTRVLCKFNGEYECKGGARYGKEDRLDYAMKPMASGDVVLYAAIPDAMVKEAKKELQPVLDLLEKEDYKAALEASKKLGTTLAEDYAKYCEGMLCYKAGLYGRSIALMGGLDIEDSKKTVEEMKSFIEPYAYDWMAMDASASSFKQSVVNVCDDGRVFMAISRSMSDDSAITDPIEKEFEGAEAEYYATVVTMSDGTKNLGVSKASWGNAAENNFEGLVFIAAGDQMAIGAADGDDSLKEYSALYDRE